MSSKDENENDKTLISSDEDDENENGKTLMSSNEDDDGTIMLSDEDDETMSQNEKNVKIKNLNDILDEIIDKSKSFEEQIKSLEKIKNLKEYWFRKNYGNKELKFKCFKLKIAYLSSEKKGWLCDPTKWLTYWFKGRY